MTPLERYQTDRLDKIFHADDAQANVVQQLNNLFNSLVEEQANKQHFFAKIQRKLGISGANFIRGLYIWGGVGRGKTHFVDTFYDCLPLAKKSRLHFHHFMQMVHLYLKDLGNVADPLQLIADDIAHKTKVLCFDEFHVADIADAMLLSGLLKALFERKVILVATSNEEPSQLYRGGLQRQRFLPAIDLIKHHMQVINIGSDVDYRLLLFKKSDVYHCPITDKTTHHLQLSFRRIATGTISVGIDIEVEGRLIKTMQHADGVVWFDFHAICGETRGYADYIHIAKIFQTVMVSDLPMMDDELNDEARRFIALIDELYDQNVKLIIAATAEPKQIYTGKRLAKPFLRTISRLEEMRTQDYLTNRRAQISLPFD